MCGGGGGHDEGGGGEGKGGKAAWAPAGKGAFMNGSVCSCISWASPVLRDQSLVAVSSRIAGDVDNYGFTFVMRCCDDRGNREDDEQSCVEG